MRIAYIHDFQSVGGKPFDENDTTHIRVEYRYNILFSLSFFLFLLPASFSYPSLLFAALIMTASLHVPVEKSREINANIF